MSAAEAMRAKERERKRKFYCKDLYALATEILGYDLLLPTFHREICDWIVEHDEDPLLYFSAARGHYKTTIQIADVIRHILIDPNKTHLWIHAVLGEAVKAAEEIANHFQGNDKLRDLYPEIMPTKNDKTFFKSSAQGSAQFTVIRPIYDRQSTLTAIGMGKEITGMHVSGSVRCDDIIGKETINETGGLQKVKSFWQHTVIPVMNPKCKARNTGTRWDPNDIYGEWIENKRWATMVRAVRETDNVPDYKGKSVGVLTEDEIDDRRKEMGAMFGPQMMNDPAPMEERFWDQSACEQYLTRAELRSTGLGRIIVLSDPAPSLLGSPTGAKEKDRFDFSKDSWANAVVMIRSRGMRHEIILLDGSSSTDWDEDLGFDEVVRLMRKWGTNLAGIEAVGGLSASYNPQFKAALRRAGWHGQRVKLTSMNKSDSKNYRFASLASRAKNDEFFICDSVPKEFLEKFLYQARNWRKIATGKNNLRHDDEADVVAYSVDPGLIEFMPMVGMQQKELDDDDWDRGRERRSRYCSI